MTLAARCLSPFPPTSRSRRGLALALVLTAGAACRTTTPAPRSECSAAAPGVTRATCCLGKLLVEARSERDLLRYNCLEQLRIQLGAVEGQPDADASARAIHAQALACHGTRSLHPEACPVD